jgi:hypothetical protein
MSMNHKCIRLLAIIALLAWISGMVPESYAQTVLSGAALENGCQAYADKAVNYAKEWERLQCQKKLNVAPQIFDTDRTYHYNRCMRSVGTTIAADLESMEKELIPCRGISGRPDTPPDKPATPTTTIPQRPDPPTTPTRTSGGDLWDIEVINSADLARSEHTFRIASLNGQFKAENTRSGGPEFSGRLSASVFDALMTDQTGYRATFIGHLSRSGRIEGTGCDNRGRSYSFTMVRR